MDMPDMVNTAAATCQLPASGSLDHAEVLSKGTIPEAVDSAMIGERLLAVERLNDSLRAEVDRVSATQ
eukprot:SAG31_NODE_6797_length_1884_cov_1.099720_2_plen_68_part_00